jgi:putative exosortase-associated protein (TIGR04073 family)
MINAALEGFFDCEFGGIFFGLHFFAHRGGARGFAHRKLFTGSGNDDTFLQSHMFMRNTLYLAGLLGSVALFAVGCAGPEEKLGRGIANSQEIIRLSEFQRAEEQSGLYYGTDVGITTGIVQGFDKTIARTGIGLYEIVTFPIPPYHPICTDYLSPKTQYPDSYKPRKWSEAVYDTDRNTGFSGGDVAPWVPGSRFRVFDY